MGLSRVIEDGFQLKQDACASLFQNTPLPPRLLRFVGRGEEQRAFASASMGGGGSGAMSKKQWTEEPFSSSRGAGQRSSSQPSSPISGFARSKTSTPTSVARSLRWSPPSSPPRGSCTTGLAVLLIYPLLIYYGNAPMAAVLS